MLADAAVQGVAIAGLRIRLVDECNEKKLSVAE
jgi:hypothetical protein